MMIDFSKYTKTELLYFSNEIKEKYEAIKKETLVLVDKIDEHKLTINQLIEDLNDLDVLHKKIIEELEK